MKINIQTIEDSIEYDLEQFGKDVVTVGCDQKCDIHVESSDQAKVLGCFYKSNGEWYVKGNGALLNGTDVEEGIVQPGDIINMSHSRLLDSPNSLHRSQDANVIQSSVNTLGHAADPAAGAGTHAIETAGAAGAAKTTFLFMTAGKIAVGFTSVVVASMMIMGGFHIAKKLNHKKNHENDVAKKNNASIQIDDPDEEKNDSGSEEDGEKKELTIEERRALYRRIYEAYINDIYDHADEMDEEYVLIHGEDAELYYCKYSISDFDQDGLDELMIYSEEWQDDFREGDLSKLSYRFYSCDLENEKTEEIGLFESSNTMYLWYDLYGDCPFDFRSNGMASFRNLNYMCFGIRDGWLFNIGFLPRESSDGTMYDEKNSNVLYGCILGSAPEEHGDYTGEIHGISGTKFWFYDEETGKAIKNEIQSGELIHPDFVSFNERYRLNHPGLTKEEAYGAVVMHTVTEDMIDSVIIDGYVCYWFGSDLENDEYIITFRPVLGTEKYYHVNAYTGDVKVYDSQNSIIETFSAKEYVDRKKDGSIEGLNNVREYAWRAKMTTELCMCEINQSNNSENGDSLAWLDDLTYDELTALNAGKNGMYFIFQDMDWDSIPEILLDVKLDSPEDVYYLYNYHSGGLQKNKIDIKEYVKWVFKYDNSMVVISDMGQSVGNDIRIEILSKVNGSYGCKYYYEIRNNRSREEKPEPLVMKGIDGIEQNISFEKLEEELKAVGVSVTSEYSEITGYAETIYYYSYEFDSNIFVQSYDLSDTIDRIWYGHRNPYLKRDIVQSTESKQTENNTSENDWLSDDQDYNDILTESLIRKTLDIPEDADIQIKYSEDLHTRGGVEEAEFVYVEANGTGEYDGYHAYGEFNIVNGGAMGIMAWFSSGQ